MKMNGTMDRKNLYGLTDGDAVYEDGYEECPDCHGEGRLYYAYDLDEDDETDALPAAEYWSLPADAEEAERLGMRRYRLYEEICRTCDGRGAAETLWKRERRLRAEAVVQAFGQKMLGLEPDGDDIARWRSAFHADEAEEEAGRMTDGEKEARRKRDEERRKRYEAEAEWRTVCRLVERARRGF